MITYILMGFNVLVFIVMTLSGVNLFEPLIESIHTWGGIRSDAIMGGSGGVFLVTCLFILE